MTVVVADAKWMFQKREQEQIDAIKRRSRELFESGMYCAESVLQAMSEAMGIQHDIIPQISTGFCGGVARTSGMCGSLAGGIMVMGLIGGRRAPADSKNLCYSMTYHLVEGFKTRFGSTQCKDILGCDIATREGALKVVENDLEAQICTVAVEFTTGLAAAIHLRKEMCSHPLL